MLFLLSKRYIYNLNCPAYIGYSYKRYNPHIFYKKKIKLSVKRVPEHLTMTLEELIKVNNINRMHRMIIPPKTQYRNLNNLKIK